MKKVYILLFVGMFLLSVLPVSVFASLDKNKDDERTEVVGLFGTLLTPSIFTTAKSEKLSASLFGRAITGEGEVPDFSGDVKDKVESLQIYINGRMGGFGATIGFGQGNEFEFSQPLILSVDYKVSLLKGVPILAAAIDGQYTMIYLPDRKTIKVSAPGFGVASINGLVSADLLFFLEPYAGVSLNYVYLNSKDDPYSVWKTVPKLGLKLNILPFISIGSEVTFVTNKILNDSWIWNIGATARF
ncbi:MAG: hypothetical protein QG641_988 [Candidatus Poribacteria bacterium]|nr:hypothetical protein [Candidatus Poribacteria bacterium]